MADDIENSRESKTESNTASSKSLISEVNNDRDRGIKNNDDSSAKAAVDAHFGKVEIVDGSKPEAKKGTDDSNDADDGKMGYPDGMPDRPKKKDKEREPSPSEAAARDDAYEVYDACGTFRNDNERVFKALENKTPEQLKAMNERFEKQHGMSMRQYLEDQMHDHPQELERANKALNVMYRTEHGDQKSIERDADSVYKACGTFSNDNEAIYKALDGKNKDQLKRMDEDFYNKHGQHMEDYLRDEMKNHPEEWKRTQAMMHPPEGEVDKDHPNMKKDENGRVTEFKDPDGQTYKFTYKENGDPATMTITRNNGTGETYLARTETEQKAHGGTQEATHWVNQDKPSSKIDSVYIDKENGDMVISGSGGYTKLKSDGSVIEKDGQTGKELKQGQHVTELHDASHAANDKEIIEKGKVSGYEFKDSSGHLTTIENKDDGTIAMHRGDQEEVFARAEKQPNGDLLLTRSNNSTLLLKNDGSQIRTNKDGHILETTSADGINTQFLRDAKDKVIGYDVIDGQGSTVEHKVVKGIEVNDKDGSYKVKLDNGNTVERQLDGTEQTRDKTGTRIDSDAEKIVKDTPNLTPEQQQKLRADLAEVDKLPEDQRKKVYESLDKIAQGDASKTKLTDQQRAELVTQLAHQVAHPEDIHQGGKMTCALASAEAQMARNHPDTYADMVSKLATEGKYECPGGKTINAHMVDGHLAGPTDGSGRRNLTSELFQNGASQLSMKDGDRYESNMPGHRPIPDGVSRSTDTGERIVHKDGSVERFDGVTAEDEAKVMNQLAPSDKYAATKPIESQADLEAAIAKNGGLPMTVGVHIGSESKFLGMSDDDSASGSGYHDINITHYEPGPPGKVYFENTAGGTDHTYPNGKGVPVDDFVGAMKGGKTKMSAIVRENPPTTIASNPAPVPATVH